MANWGQLSLMDASSFIMENIIEFHDFGMMIILMIIMMVLYIIVCMWSNKFVDLNLLENQYVEFIWTLVPVGFLFFLAIPSLKILYMIDEIYKPVFTVKVLGHQWYWSYEFSDFESIDFDSFMISMFDKEMEMFRLLDVDNRLVVPLNSEIRLLVSSVDVIHSFTIPSAGVKIDAVPGRINQFGINMSRVGLFFGQCSEICGVNHSFMPNMLC